MPVPYAERVMKLLEEGMSLWKTFIATRQEAYNRKQDKKQVKAIEFSEKYIFANDKLIESLKNLSPKAMQGKTIKKRLKTVAYYRTKFFKYN